MRIRPGKLIPRDDEPRATVVGLEVAHPKGRAHGKPLEMLARQFLAKVGEANVELSVSLVTDRAIQKLNRIWRGKDKPTDVLSFPAGDSPAGSPGPKLLGDVVISLDTAVRQAKEEERPLKEELARYLAHGILHLLGHDHERPADARRMAEQEDALLGAAGMVREARLAEPRTARRRPSR